MNWHLFFEFNLITPKGDRIIENQIILDNFNDFIIRGKKPLELAKLAKQIGQAIRTVNPDIIHIQMTSSLVLFVFLLNMKAINKNIKVIYTDRGVYGKYGKITTFSINRLISKADCIVTTTEVNKRNYETQYPMFEKEKHKFNVVYNTAGKEFENNSSIKRYNLKNDFNINEEEIVIGFCGRYSKQKKLAISFRNYE